MLCQVVLWEWLGSWSRVKRTTRALLEHYLVHYPKTISALLRLFHKSGVGQKEESSVIYFHAERFSWNNLSSALVVLG